MLYEFVHFHPDIPVVLFGIDPHTAEWAFLESGNCSVGVEGVAEHDGLVVSFGPGRVASVGVSVKGNETGSRGAVRVVDAGTTSSDARSVVVATPEDGVFQLVRAGGSGVNFIPTTLPAGRVPTTKPVP